ncbi:hypothetical protein SBOR_1769 [Sclerotinia borealis F-4128]|uniref:Uncharacterized protein n=1 Tax=Sclerotinia borealis (strain F-4128) TaxID=1432307 RepID=W9CPD7_SCLBF|nr:hypothetical protein SBOR_1769 [Sclerotinia borealis F-4128]
MFSKGTRIAFNGIFRHENKDFRLVENMDQTILRELFFDICHSSNPSEHADITPAVRGVRDARKFFFVSCNYHDPEYVIVCIYSKLRDFDWNNQASINNLNTFRKAAITEACGVFAFGGDGKPLTADEVEAILDARRPKKQNTGESMVTGTTNAPDKEGQDDGEVSTSSEMQGETIAVNPVQPVTQIFQPQPAAQLFQFQFTYTPHPWERAAQPQHYGAYAQNGPQQVIAHPRTKDTLPLDLVSKATASLQFLCRLNQVTTNCRTKGMGCINNVVTRRASVLSRPKDTECIDNMVTRPALILYRPKDTGCLSLVNKIPTSSRIVGTDFLSRFSKIVTSFRTKALQAFNNVDSKATQGGNVGTDAGEVASRNTSNVPSHQNHQGASVEADDGDVAPQGNPNTMTRQELADAFQEPDLTFEDSMGL